jgi:hypothetical protein
MRWTRRLTMSLSLLLLLGYFACSSVPNSWNDDLRLVQSREVYVDKHPGEQFNKYIERGEVVRGMNYVQVSASWGLPETRRLSSDRKQEYWTFFGKDELSGDWTRYTFVFEEGVLADWQMDRHFAKNGALANHQTPGGEPSSASGGPPGSTSSGSDRP